MITRSRTTLCAIISFSALSLVGCSFTPYTVPEAPAPDLAVAELLPTGPYLVSGQFANDGGAVLKIDGFVDFGAAPDGVDCESESTHTNFSADATQSSRREVHTAGGPTWYQDRSNPAAPGEWYDIADPEAPIGMLLLFVPALIASQGGPGMFEGAGAGSLCSIGTMPRFMAVDGDQLVFDAERTVAAVAASYGRWVKQFVDASYSRIVAGKVARELAEMGIPSYAEMTRNTTIVIERTADDGVTLTQIREGKPMLELRFTRTEDRAVKAIDGVTFFERLAADVKK